MKKIKKALALVLALCLMAGMFVGLNVQASTVATYELYDYLDKVAYAHDNGTAIENDTPWSLQINQQGNGWVESLDTTSRTVDGADWVYYTDAALPTGDGAWGGYAPGFAFYAPQDTSGRYYYNMAIPTRSAWAGTDRWSNAGPYSVDVAYAFTAPASGVYKVDKANQDKVLTFDDCNSFQRYMAGDMADNRKLDYGVRITVDGNTVWPASDYEYAENGWAVFGYRDALTTSIPVPTVDDIELAKGQVLRVEFTLVTPAYEPDICRIKGSFNVTFVEARKVAVPEPTEPTTYELYDYLDKVAYGHDNNEMVENNTPWSLQLNQQGNGWVESLDTTSRAIDGADWVYYTDAVLPSGDAAWGGYAPGFAFYAPQDTSGRYYYNMAIPSRSAWAGTDRWSNAGPYSVDVAYAFTAPTDGMYKVDKANQNKVLTFDDCNSFQRYMLGDMTDNRKLDYGVRITVDGETVWPAYDYEYAENGWAVFGYREAKTTSIPVPTVNDIEMKKGQVLRVEFTVVTPSFDCDVCRIKGSFSVSYVEPLQEEIDIPTEYTFYDIYDHYANLVEGTANYTPWSVETNMFTAENAAGAGWEEAVALSDWDGYYRYLHSTLEWGGNWPGVKFYYPAADKEAGARYQYGYITALALQGTNIYGWDSAYTFKTPYTGNFTFAKGNQDMVISWDAMNSFQYENKSAGMNAGVRITVNGKTVWPATSDANYYEGYARFGNNVEGVAEKIEIPTLDLFLEKNDVVRVEFKQFSNGAATMPWDQQIMGLVSMSYDPNKSDIATGNIRTYEDLGLYIDEVGAVNTTTEMYADEFAYTTIPTTANDGLSLSVYAPNQGVKIALNGFEVVLNGAESTLTAPGKETETFAVASSADDIYEITVRVSPVLTQGAITGTYFDVTVNGMSTMRLYDDIIPAGVRDNGIVITNISGDSIELRAGGIALAKGSNFIVDIENKVLYVGTVTDIAAVKANIKDAGLYLFSSDVATNATFVRQNGSEYSFAVKGDLTGDGVNDIKDLIRMKRAIAEIVELSAAQEMAASFGESDKAYADCLKDIAKYILSK